MLVQSPTCSTIPSATVNALVDIASIGIFLVITLFLLMLSEIIDIKEDSLSEDFRHF